MWLWIGFCVFFSMVPKLQFWCSFYSEKRNFQLQSWGWQTCPKQQREQAQGLGWSSGFLHSLSQQHTTIPRRQLSFSFTHTRKKKISLFYTLWGKTHQHLPGLRPQSAVDYEPKLCSFTARLLLSRGGIRSRWGQGERPRRRAADRRRKRSRDLACLWCSAPSPHTDVNGRVWGNKGENSIEVQTPMELKEKFRP